MSAVSLREEQDIAANPDAGTYAAALWWGLKGGVHVEWGSVFPAGTDGGPFQRKTYQ